MDMTVDKILSKIERFTTYTEEQNEKKEKTLQELQKRYDEIIHAKEIHSEKIGKLRLLCTRQNELYEAIDELTKKIEKEYYDF